MAAGYVFENKDPDVVAPLLLDAEQVRIVAEMNDCTLLLEDPRNPEDLGKVRFARLGSAATSEAG